MLNIIWSEPKKYSTSAGFKWSRYWVLPDDKDIVKSFWTFYQSKKIVLRLQGFSVKKNKEGKWVFEQIVSHPKEFKGSVDKTESPIDYSKIDFTKSDLPPYSLKDDKIKNILREFQIPMTEAICSSIIKHGAAINGSEMGSGKTFCSVAVAKELGFKIGVVCPKSVITPWTKVISNEFGMKKNLSFVLNYESVKGGKYKNIGILQAPKGKKKKVFTWKCSKDTLIIFDESQRIKGRDTINAEIAIQAKKQGYKILLCSGTAAISPLELRAAGYILGLHNLTDYYKWLYEHGCFKGIYGMEFNNDKTILKKLHKDLFLDKGVRIKKEDIKGFPDCETIVDAFDIDDESVKKMNEIYKTMQKELLLLKAKKKRDTAAEMVIKLRARQEAELLKVPLLIEMVEECLENDQSVVLIVNFSETIKALSKRLNTNCIVWGNNKNNEREDNIEKFQLDKERVIILNIQAGGVGVSLHDLNGRYPRVSLISPNHSAVLLRQALGRIHRDEAKSKAIQKVVYIANTEEEEVCKKVKSKLNNLDMINDGDLTIGRVI